MICHSSRSLSVSSPWYDAVSLQQARTHTRLETHTTHTSQLSSATSAQRGAVSPDLRALLPEVC